MEVGGLEEKEVEDELEQLKDDALQDAAPMEDDAAMEDDAPKEDDAAIEGEAEAWGGGNDPLLEEREAEGLILWPCGAPLLSSSLIVQRLGCRTFCKKMFSVDTVPSGVCFSHDFRHDCKQLAKE